MTANRSPKEVDALLVADAEAKCRQIAAFIGGWKSGAIVTRKPLKRILEILYAEKSAPEPAP